MAGGTDPSDVPPGEGDVPASSWTPPADQPAPADLTPPAAPTPIPPAASGWSPPPASGWTPPDGWKSPPTGPARSPVAILLRQILLVMTGIAVATGAVTVRVGVMLSGRVERDLVSTEESQPLEIAAIAGLLALVGLSVLLVIWAVPWLKGSRAALQDAWDGGGVGVLTAGPDGTPVRHPTRDSLGILFARAGVAPAGAWYDVSVASSLRTAVSAAALAGIAVPVLLAGALMVAVAADRDVSRAGWWVIAAGTAPLALAGVLAWWLVGDLDRRRRIAAQAADPSALPSGDPGARRWPAVAVVVFLIFAFLSSAPGALQDEAGRVCPSSLLDCRWVTVQADHLASDGRGATRTVLYGVQRATGTRVGTIVIATGGPGISGVATWDTEYAALDPRLTEAFDVVAFDARGTGGSGGVDCPEATTTYWERLRLDADARIIATFADACLAEAGVAASDLGQYAGAQIAEDVEAIRDDLGVERIVFYGESYGTAIAQRYAMAHPERLQALILDGALDIARDTDDAWLEAAVAFDDVLGRVLDWCSVDITCADELGDPHGTWDELISGLAEQPGSATFADATGRVREWPVTASDAVNVLSNAMYWETGRMLALRALAAADRGDLVPLGRMIHPGDVGLSDIVVVSDFAYVATWCADRVDEDQARDGAAYLAWAGDQVETSGRMVDVLLSGAACAAWPVPAGPRPPTTLPALDAPVVILTSTADPITPPEIGRRLAARFAESADVYRIETSAGPHVTFGRGAACPDDTIVRLLVEGIEPEARTTCIGQLVSTFQPVVRRSVDVDGVLLRAYALDDEAYNHPDYASWTGEGELRLGCRFGGSIRITATTDGFRLTFASCAVLEDEPMTGTGAYGMDGTVTFEATFPRGEFAYQASADGSVDITGTLDGTQFRASY